jgi:hypothetical protein
MHPLELRPKREDRETVVAVIRIENIDTCRHLLVHELCEQAALDIAVALIDHCALSDEAEAQPFKRTEAELVPRVGEAVLPNLEVAHILRFRVEVYDAIAYARLEPRRFPLSGQTPLRGSA